MICRYKYPQIFQMICQPMICDVSCEVFTPRMGLFLHLHVSLVVTSRWPDVSCEVFTPRMGLFLHLHVSLVVTSRWPESSGWPR